MFNFFKRKVEVKEDKNYSIISIVDSNISDEDIEAYFTMSHKKVIVEDKKLKIGIVYSCDIYNMLLSMNDNIVTLYYKIDDPQLDEIIDFMNTIIESK